MKGYIKRDLIASVKRNNKIKFFEVIINRTYLFRALAHELYNWMP